jgi:hypothetical protein
MSVRDLIDAIYVGDSESIETTFNHEMAERISARLDAMRVEVAKNMFNEQVEELDEGMLDSIRRNTGSVATGQKREDKSANFDGNTGKQLKPTSNLAAQRTKMQNNSSMASRMRNEELEELEEDKDAERERKRKQKELLRQAERFEKTKPHGWGTLANMARAEAAKLNKEETE